MKVTERKFEIICMGKSEVSYNFTDNIFPKDKYIRHVFSKSKDGLLKFIMILLKSKNKNYVFPFLSIKDFFVLPLLLFQKKKTFVCFHDFYLHKGEYNFMLQFFIYLEYFICSEVIVFNNNVKQDIKESFVYRISKKKIHVFFHGIKNKNYLKIKKLNNSDSLNVLYIGRIHEYKGVLNLVKGFKKINQNEFKLRILGRGKISNQIKQIIDSTPSIFLENRWLDNDEIENEIKNSHIVVLPYIESTQSGIMSDSFAFNTPCLITPTKGLINQGLFGSFKISGFQSIHIEKALMEIKRKPSIVEDLSKSIQNNKNKYFYSKLEEEFLKMIT